MVRDTVSRLEPIIWVFVVASIVFTIWALLMPREKLATILSAGERYDLIVKFVFSSLLGVGLYSLMGARIWCRYFCPWAGLFGLLAAYGRYAIRTRGELCMACGMCSTYCEMGIDIRGHAMRGEPREFYVELHYKMSGTNPVDDAVSFTTEEVSWIVRILRQWEKQVGLQPPDEEGDPFILV